MKGDDIYEFTKSSDWDKFQSWAFGGDCEDKQAMDIMNMWNEKHGSKVKISEDETILESLFKMIDLYKKEHHEQRSHNNP